MWLRPEHTPLLTSTLQLPSSHLDDLARVIIGLGGLGAVFVATLRPNPLEANQVNESLRS